ncbi:MAG: methyltransferase domain-containing protein, partial [Candidatus Aenigmarchaeota archaeon]|nr:methyltransferase domain-containing protein [Candidatus Aenigmarchaeota archaeon]
MKIGHLRQILSRLPRNARILDAGCGEGIVSKYVRSVRPDAIIYGIDVVDCSKKLPKAMKFSLNSVEDTQFRSNFFDAILCFHVIEHLEMPERCIDELYRI